MRMIVPPKATLRYNTCDEPLRVGAGSRPGPAASGPPGFSESKFILRLPVLLVVRLLCPAIYAAKPTMSGQGVSGYLQLIPNSVDATWCPSGMKNVIGLIEGANTDEIIVVMGALAVPTSVAITHLTGCTSGYL